MPDGCPYRPVTGDGLPNAYARVQCFITRAEFIRAQTAGLRLQMGLFAFEWQEDTDADRRNLHYLTRSKYKNLQLAHLVYDPRTGWTPDRYEHQKSHLFQATRAAGTPTIKPSQLLERVRGLKGENDQEWRGLTPLEDAAQIIYSEDGEMSAYCLRFLLEELSTDGLLRREDIDNEDDLAITEVVQRMRIHDGLSRWYDPADENSPGRKVEWTILNRFPILGGEPHPLRKFLDFESSVTGSSLLQALGVMTRERLATERFWRLIRHLYRVHPSREPDVLAHIDELLTLADRQRRSGRAPKVLVPPHAWKALLLWVATGAKLKSDRAPITRDGCLGHLFLRRSFRNSGVDTSTFQIETCARSWLAFPIFAYEPHRQDRGRESQQVGFFFGTFDDSDCYDVSGELDTSRLLEQVGRIRSVMHLLGSVEAQGFYVEDLVVRSEQSEGARRRDAEWLDALESQRDLQPIVQTIRGREQQLQPSKLVRVLARYANDSREISGGPICLEYSALFELPTRMWQLTAHSTLPKAGEVSDFQATEQEVRTAYNMLNDQLMRFQRLTRLCGSAGTLLMQRRSSEGEIDKHLGGKSLFEALQQTVQKELDKNRFSDYLYDGPDGVHVRANDTISMIRGYLNVSLVKLENFTKDLPPNFKLLVVKGLRGSESGFPLDPGADHVFPFHFLAGLLGEVFRSRNKAGTPKLGQNAVVVAELPPSDGLLSAMSIRRAVVVVREDLRDPALGAKVLTGQIACGGTADALRSAGFDRVCDLWIFVRDDMRRLEGSRISRGTSTEGIQATLLGVVPASLNSLFEGIEELHAPGVYWTFLLSWLRHLNPGGPESQLRVQASWSSNGAQNG